MVDNTQTNPNATQAEIDALNRQALQQNANAMNGGMSDAEDSAREAAKYAAAFSVPRDDLAAARTPAVIAGEAAYNSQRYNTISSGGSYSQPSNQGGNSGSNPYDPNSAAGIQYDIQKSGGTVAPLLQSKAFAEGYRGGSKVNTMVGPTTGETVIDYGMNTVGARSVTPEGYMYTNPVTGRTIYQEYPQNAAPTYKEVMGAYESGSKSTLPMNYPVGEDKSVQLGSEDSRNIVLTRMNPVSGRVETYSTILGHPGQVQLEGGGSDWFAQSGKGVLGKSNSAVVLNRDLTVNKKLSASNYLDVLANPDRYSKSGAEAYGGQSGILLDDRYVSSSPGKTMPSSWWDNAIATGEKNAKANTQANPTTPVEIDSRASFINANSIGNFPQSKDSINLANLMYPRTMGTSYVKGEETPGFIAIDLLKNYGTTPTKPGNIIKTEPATTLQRVVTGGTYNKETGLIEGNVTQQNPNGYWDATLQDLPNPKYGKKDAVVSEKEGGDLTPRSELNAASIDVGDRTFYNPFNPTNSLQYTETQEKVKAYGNAGANTGGSAFVKGTTWQEGILSAFDNLVRASPGYVQPTTQVKGEKVAITPTTPAGIEVGMKEGSIQKPFVSVGKTNTVVTTTPVSPDEFDNSRGWIQGILPNVDAEHARAYSVANKSNPVGAILDASATGIRYSKSAAFGALSEITGGLTGGILPAETFVSQKAVPAQFKETTSTVRSGGSAEQDSLYAYLTTEKDKIDLTNADQVNAYNAKRERFLLLEKQNPTEDTTTTTKELIAGTGTEEVRENQWDLFSKGTGRIGRAILNVSLAKQNAYYETIKNEGGVIGEAKRVVFFAGTTATNNPAALAPAAIQGAGFVYGGEALGLAGTAIATSGKKGSEIAAALMSPKGQIAIKGAAAVGFTTLFAYQVSEGFTATPEKTKENAYKSIPTLAAMYAGGGGMDWMSDINIKKLPSLGQNKPTTKPTYPHNINPADLPPPSAPLAELPFPKDLPNPRRVVDPNAPQGEIIVDRNTHPGVKGQQQPYKTETWEDISQSFGESNAAPSAPRTNNIVMEPVGVGDRFVATKSPLGKNAPMVMEQMWTPETPLRPMDIGESFPGGSKPNDMVRLYRGGSNAKIDTSSWMYDAMPSGQKNAMGRWFTESKVDAQWYKNDAGAKGVIKSVNVPRSVADQYLVSNIKETRVTADGLGQVEDAPWLYPSSNAMAGKEIFLPREIANQAKPIASWEQRNLDIQTGKRTSKPTSEEISYFNAKHGEGSNAIHTKTRSRPNDVIKEPFVSRNVGSTVRKETVTQSGFDFSTLASGRSGGYGENLGGGEGTGVASRSRATPTIKPATVNVETKTLGNTITRSRGTYKFESRANDVVESRPKQKSKPTYDVKNYDSSTFESEMPSRGSVEKPKAESMMERESKRNKEVSLNVIAPRMGVEVFRPRGKDVATVKEKEARSVSEMKKKELPDIYSRPRGRDVGKSVSRWNELPKVVERSKGKSEPEPSRLVVSKFTEEQPPKKTERLKTPEIERIPPRDPDPIKEVKKDNPPPPPPPVVKKPPGFAIPSFGGSSSGAGGGGRGRGSFREVLNIGSSLESFFGSRPSQLTKRRRGRNF